ncbi:uncharacterized protein LOC109948113 [Prunus persica]|uniref:uncharacterized protein LOC109948113 n=1 Tax=Prunus persica TaxID=3760 RepID=UPI0009AB2966|nr:uncharacterized protein LOC109948113 [Prunus persica]
MATSSSSSDSPALVSSTLHSSSASSIIGAHHLVNVVPVKLRTDNYLLWKNVCLPILESYDFLGLIDGSDRAPDRVLLGPPGFSSPQLNPAFSAWSRRDKHCLICLQGSLSEEILPYVVGAATSRTLWLNLERRFSSLSESHIIELQSKLQSLSKGDHSMSQYLKSIKHIADSLAAAGTPLSSAALVVHTLNGLPAEYHTFATSICTRSTPIVIDELHSLLLVKNLLSFAKIL